MTLDADAATLAREARAVLARWERPDAQATGRDSNVIQPGQRSLGELAGIANREHEAVGAALHSAIAHAIRVGEALHEARLRIGSKGWPQWCAENVGFSFTAITRYQRLFVYREHLPDEAFQPSTGPNGAIYQPSVNRAFAYISGLPGLYCPRMPTETLIECRRLFEQGVPIKEIASLLSMSVNGVKYNCIPGVRERRMEQIRRKKLRDKRARFQKEEERRDLGKAIARASGSLADAYSLVRRAAQRTDEAIYEATTTERRSALSTALAGLHSAEDAIVQAMRMAPPA